MGKEQGLRLAESRGDEHQISLLHIDLGDVALAQGEPEVARRHLERSSQIEPHNPWTLLGWGRLHLALGHSQAAAEQFCQALHRALELGVGPLVLEILFHLAQHRLERGELKEGVELLGVALNHAAFSHALRRQTERLLTGISLPATDLEAALSRGRARDLESLVDDMLAGAEPRP